MAKKKKKKKENFLLHKNYYSLYKVEAGKKKIGVKIKILLRVKNKKSVDIFKVVVKKSGFLILFFLELSTLLKKVSVNRCLMFFCFPDKKKRTVF